RRPAPGGGRGGCLRGGYQPAGGAGPATTARLPGVRRSATRPLTCHNQGANKRRDRNRENHEMIRNLAIAALLALTVALPAREAAAQNTLGGAIVGGVGGAIVGGAIGGSRGAAIGAVVGAGGGGGPRPRARRGRGRRVRSH